MKTQTILNNKNPKYDQNFILWDTNTQNQNWSKPETSSSLWLLISYRDFVAVLNMRKNCSRKIYSVFNTWNSFFRHFTGVLSHKCFIGVFTWQVFLQLFYLTGVLQVFYLTADQCWCINSLCVSGVSVMIWTMTGCWCQCSDDPVTAGQCWHHCECTLFTCTHCL